ncbi:MAG: formylglycine-generating enzyme family protein [Rhodocyclaceae bacterium]|nr:formylglycine-generating enzyme family protein [Rhodocyclaceae bacterium]
MSAEAGRRERYHGLVIVLLTLGVGLMVAIDAHGQREATVPVAAGRSVTFDPGDTFRDCAVCPEMVVVPAGEFRMGSPASELGLGRDEGPPHRVRIGEAFAVGKFEVTFAQWDACVGAGGCRYRPKDNWGRDAQPVIKVSWNDAQVYLNWLSEKTGRSYRLLSEAEWEYAARAGSTTRYPWGDEPGRGNANFDASGGPLGSRQSTPVGRFDANRFGLYDMIGNVAEWVADCWHGSYQGAPADGRAWTSGDCERRVVRGGSWYDVPANARSALRLKFPPGLRNLDLGFRVARAF